MTKKKLIGIISTIIVLGGLLIFAGTHKFEDSHLRINGIRVRVEDAALSVSDCDEEDIAHCKINKKIGDKDATILFEFTDFKKNGYPKTLKATINGHEFYREDNLQIEDRGSLEYNLFTDFTVMDNYLVFTHTHGNEEKSTTLYAIDIDGNIILKEYDIDTDGMRLKDFQEFLKFEDNKITVYATKLVQNSTYNDVNVCDLDDKVIIEAHYTYTLKNGKFTKKQIDTINAKEFIEKNEYYCPNKK